MIWVVPRWCGATKSIVWVIILLDRFKFQETMSSPTGSRCTGMEAKKEMSLTVQKAILTVLLIVGCLTCLWMVLPAARL